ncbi:hypothetical protein EU523_00240 [Candidatus Heimdallarchaeota archaeon]|nr:MAG: hypothetical protein EU523_00240 [Candidatus Heimdallarchaeota archaeon]
MASLKNVFGCCYSEVILFGILFLFFIQLLTDLVSSIFALNLLTVSLNLYVAIIFFLLCSIFLVFTKKVPDALIFILGIFAIICRLVEGLLQMPAPKAIIAGLGCAAFILFLPAYLWRKATVPNNDFQHSALRLGSGFSLSIVFSLLFRTIGSSLDITQVGWFQIIGWLLGIISVTMLSLLLINDEFWLSEEVKSQEQKMSAEEIQPANELESIDNKSSFWKILGLAVGFVGSIAIAYFFLASPAVISRWVEGNYLSIIISISLLTAGFIILSLLVPHFLNYLKPWILWLWNGLFIFSFTIMLLVYQPQFTIFRQILLYLMLLLSPIIYIDFTLITKELLESKPTLRKLAGGFTLSFFFVILTIFGAIFTIAYDYIPVVGPFFRDKHWFVMMLIVFSGTLPVLIVKAKTIQFKAPKLSAISLKKKILVSIVSLLFLGTIAGGIATLPYPSTPATTPTSIKFVTFNIQQGFDMEGRLNFSGILYDLQQIDADVIGLQESDTCRISSGNNDIVRYLAQKLHLYSYFGPKTVTGTFGIALLSKYPISNMKTHYMYSEGEQTATIEAQITIETRTFNVFVTHFGEYEIDKEKQAEKIVMLTSGKSNVVLLGDFNFEPWSVQYNITTTVLNDAWLTVWPSGVDDTGYNGLTFSWGNPHSHIDFIFVSSDISLLDCRVATWAHSSDHMPVTASIFL